MNLVNGQFPLVPVGLRARAYILREWMDLGPVSTPTDGFFTNVFTNVFPGRDEVDNRRLPEQDIAVTWGIPDGSHVASPSTLEIVLWNDDGWLTNGNRRSPWWMWDGTGWGRKTPFQLIEDGDVVFWGEVTGITSGWTDGDVSVFTETTFGDEPIVFDGPDHFGNDIDDPGYAHVTVTVSGELRRRGQRQPPLRSPLNRLALFNARANRLASYHPMEDGADATTIASGIDGKPPATITGFSLASDSTLPGSDPLPRLSKGSDGAWTVPIRNGQDLAGHWCIDWFGFHSEKPTETGTYTRILEVRTVDATVATWTVDLLFDGVDHAMWVRGFDNVGDPVPGVERYQRDLANFYGRMLQLQLTVENGGVWSFLWSEVGPDHPSFGFDGTEAGAPGYPKQAAGGFVNSACDVVVGHVMARRTDTPMPSGWAVPADIGWLGDTAIGRAVRLCGEVGVALTVDAFPGNRSQKMGIQRSGKFLDLLSEAVATDGGMLLERRKTSPGLWFRPLRSLYGREPVLTISCRTGGIVNPFEPTADDIVAVTSQTVERIGGTRVEVVDPVADEKWGTYEDTAQLSLDTDRKHRPRNQATWRLHLGTDDNDRFTEVTIDFARAANPAAAKAAWRQVNAGDVVRFVDLPPQYPDWPGYIDQIVMGATDHYGGFDRTAKLTTRSFEGWRVGRFGEMRYSARNSRLAAAVDADSTTMLVRTDGKLWTSDPSKYPIDFLVGDAEVVRATSAEATAPGGVQAIHVIRNINGLGRSHETASPFLLADRSVMGL